MPERHQAEDRFGPTFSQLMLTSDLARMQGTGTQIHVSPQRLGVL